MPRYENRALPSSQTGVLTKRFALNTGFSPRIDVADGTNTAIGKGSKYFRIFYSVSGIQLTLWVLSFRRRVAKICILSKALSRPYTLRDAL